MRTKEKKQGKERQRKKIKKKANSSVVVALLDIVEVLFNMIENDDNEWQRRRQMWGVLMKLCAKGTDLQKKRKKKRKKRKKKKETYLEIKSNVLFLKEAKYNG